MFAPLAMIEPGLLMNIIEQIEREQLNKDVGEFRVGDTVRVHTKIKEFDAEGKPRERIQIFTGVVIARRGRGIHETFTVRRISYGEGVERIFPLHSPNIAQVEVERRGHVRRAKLHYLRARIGKGATKVKEKTSVALPATASEPEKEAAAQTSAPSAPKPAQEPTQPLAGKKSPKMAEAKAAASA